MSIPKEQLKRYRDGKAGEKLSVRASRAAGGDQQTGPRGGSFYINASGNKVYGTKPTAEPDKPPKESEAPKDLAPRTWTDKPPEGMSDETWKDHYDKHPDSGGQASAERVAEVHDPIIKKALDVKPAAPGEQKVAIMTMGGPASGKSSMMKGQDTDKFVKVDPDAIKEQLPEYKAATENRDATYVGAAAMAHEESSHVARQVLAGAIKNGNHIIVDGTGAKAKSFLEKMDALKAAGYHVHVMMPHLDVETGIQRMRSRAEKNGRMVPEPFARKAYEDIPRNFNGIASKADSYELFDSSPSQKEGGARLAHSYTKEGGHVDHDPAFMKKFRATYGGR